MRTTSRGFKVYGEFIDTRGVVVRVQESSADPLGHAWLFADGDGVYDPARKHEICQHAPHLDVEQAELLIAALQAFVADKRGEGDASTPEPGRPGGDRLMPREVKWVTRLAELEGKTIARALGDYRDGELDLLLFTDGTVALVKSEHESSCAVLEQDPPASVFDLDYLVGDLESARLHLAVVAGLATPEEVVAESARREAESRAAQVRHERAQYEALKKKFGGEET